jgi:hypothetical protein
MHTGVSSSFIIFTALLLCDTSAYTFINAYNAMNAVIGQYPQRLLRTRPPPKDPLFRLVSRKVGTRRCLLTNMLTETQPVRTAFGRDSTVLVVGASKGLGLEFVKQLLSKGCEVFATHRGTQASKDLADMRLLSGGRLHLLECDITSSVSIQTAAQKMRGRCDYTYVTTRSQSVLHLYARAFSFLPRTH